MVQGRPGSPIAKQKGYTSGTRTGDEYEYEEKIRDQGVMEGVEEGKIRNRLISLFSYTVHFKFFKRGRGVMGCCVVKRGTA